MSHRILSRSLLLALPLTILSGCGLEGIVNEFGGKDYTQPVSVIRGSVALASPTFTVLDPDDQAIEPFDVKFEDGRYEIQLISGAYQGLRVQATQGEVMLESFVPDLEAEGAVEGVDLDVTSTLKVVVVEGLLGPSGKTLKRLSGDLLCVMGKKIDAAVAQGGPAADLLGMMEAIVGEADLTVSTKAYVFRTPEVDESYTVLTSALNPGWVARTLFDYDGDGRLNQTTASFDTTFVATLQGLELTAPPDPTRIRVVFAVDFNDGKLNGACGKINRFKWVGDEPGKSMFFVGGIVEDSPIQSTEIDAMLGNRGGWTPNQIPMYDDGTHGDEKAGDNIWSIYFDLPRGLHMGYKYTWGHQGDLWTGSEEWPGNRRLLNVEDVNGDGYVYRFDNFGDEASNKDLANLNPKSGGSLSWDEDLNGDGYPEAGETPVDLNNDCVPDEFVTPDWVPALTVSCADFEAK